MNCFSLLDLSVLHNMISMSMTQQASSWFCGATNDMPSFWSTCSTHIVNGLTEKDIHVVTEVCCPWSSSA